MQGHQLSWCDFLFLSVVLPGKCRLVPQLGHSCFLPDPLQFIIHQPLHCLTPNSLDTEITVTQLPSQSLKQVQFRFEVFTVVMIHIIVFWAMMMFRRKTFCRWRRYVPLKHWYPHTRPQDYAVYRNWEAIPLEGVIIWTVAYIQYHWCQRVKTCTWYKGWPESKDLAHMCYLLTLAGTSFPSSQQSRPGSEWFSLFHTFQAVFGRHVHA